METGCVYKDKTRKTLYQDYSVDRTLDIWHIRGSIVATGQTGTSQTDSQQLLQITISSYTNISVTFPLATGIPFCGLETLISCEAILNLMVAVSEIAVNILFFM